MSTSSSTGPLDGPPVVVDIGQTQSWITPGEFVTLNAFVSHPLGEQSVVSGQLLGPGDPPLYGVFERVAPGRWRVELSYDESLSRGPLEFGEFVDLEFTARFEDEWGRSGERSLLVRHDCEVSSSHSCGGICTNITISTEHCGGCGNECDEQSVLGASAVLGDCFERACTPSWSACIDAEASSCAEVCEQRGRTCAEGGCAGRTVLYEREGSRCAIDVVDGIADTDASCSTSLLAGRHRCCCNPLTRDG